MQKQKIGILFQVIVFYIVLNRRYFKAPTTIKELHNYHCQVFVDIIGGRTFLVSEKKRKTLSVYCFVSLKYYSTCNSASVCAGNCVVMCIIMTYVCIPLFFRWCWR